MNGGGSTPGENPSKLYVSVGAEPCDSDLSSCLCVNCSCPFAEDAIFLSNSHTRDLKKFSMGSRFQCLLVFSSFPFLLSSSLPVTLFPRFF